MNKMKHIPLLVIIIGVIITCYGSWKIIDTHMKTKQSLEEAKKAAAPVGTEGKIKKSAVQKQRKAAFQPKVGKASGILEIPKIDAELPIVEGTDADDLAKGVGHYKDSYYPDEHGQIVLSGHRDTVFRRTGELDKGDQLIIILSYGTFSYKITHTKIVSQNDTSVITLQHEREELVLTTCYPFSYIGNAPKRYIIYAEPV
ncbi:class D sortase [Bacillus sp. ISL-51]|uniref:class D sortase n=1 Tax=Bacteria TaxID=2 RepID=UPI001BE7D19A|nr:MULTISPECIES: class D sortase [Bacteria]MBT2574026.1 class D sortase [Bacillus sp. ISL-51]MBT2634643.1 class D sortase [Bacillus sp. ISL-26]